MAAERASRGADALGFDYVRNKCRPKGPIVTMDLTQKHGQTLVMESVTSGRVHVNIMAPPCGTASRARERPIKNGPKPLRSEAQPMGLPGLTGEDLDRVQAANALYALVARVASACNEAGVLWVVENPARSIFWWIPEIVALLELHGVHDVYYDTCMFGGQRLKHQRLRGNFPELAAMGKMCDKAHVHLPYSRSQSGFDTALEAEYPRVFCVKLVDCCVAALQRKGLRLPDPKFVSNRYVDVREQVLRKIAAWKQPRGRRSPQLLPEFKEVISLPKVVLGQCTLDSKLKTMQTVAQESFTVPVGSKLLGGKGAVEFDPCRFGVFRSPTEWHQQAKQLSHPSAVVFTSDATFLWTLQEVMKLGRTGLRERRKSVLAHYRERARQLEHREAALHGSLQPSVQKVMATKKLLLMKEMMRDAGMDPEPLFQRLCSGFELTGVFPDTGLFKPRFLPPAISKEELWKSAKWSQTSVGERLRSSGDQELDEAIRAETLQERDRGWLDGPLTEKQLFECFGPCWVPNRRFCVRQGDKTPHG